jgi:hypothetical protein
MMKKRTLMWSGALLAALFLVSTVLTGCTTKSESAAPAPNSAVGPVVSSAVAPAVTEKSAPGAPQEGITVHGHWTIEVTNPDGSLAERREFENASAGSGFGSSLLAVILGRLNSMGGWEIDLGDPFATNGPWPSSMGVIVESNYAGDTLYAYKNLTVQVPSLDLNNPDFGKLVLRGTATAAQSGQFARVATYFWTQSPLNPPSPFYPGSVGNLFPFTVKVLDVPVVIAAGQQILVTVVISFS